MYLVGSPIVIEQAGRSCTLWAGDWTSWAFMYLVGSPMVIEQAGRSCTLWAGDRTSWAFMYLVGSPMVIEQAGPSCTLWASLWWSNNTVYLLTHDIALFFSQLHHVTCTPEVTTASAYLLKSALYWSQVYMQPLSTSYWSQAWNILYLYTLTSSTPTIALVHG